MVDRPVASGMHSKWPLAAAQPRVTHLVTLVPKERAPVLSGLNRSTPRYALN